MNNQYTRALGPLELRGKSQSYSWGKIGASSRIAPFLAAYDAAQPLAEYWLGTHPKGPSDLVLPSGDTVQLGAHLGADRSISFMLKVLSINPDFGLSIQSHPDSRWAKILHQRDPANYPDDSHKPEIGVALTPVTLLFGFRSLKKLADVVSRVPALHELWGRGLMNRLFQASEGAHQPELLKELFARVLSASERAVAAVVNAVCEARDGHESYAEERAIIRRLRRCYGDGDPGLLAIFMMNVVRLEPGEAVFIGPNCPHAYLDGDLVECMVSSDNVIRAGLTSKFKDTATLLETISYSEVDVLGKVTTKGALGDLALFDLPINDFALATAERGSSLVSTGALTRDAIMLCVGGEVEVTGANRSVRLRDGGAVFLPASSEPYTISRSDAALYLATRL